MTTEGESAPNSGSNMPKSSEELEAGRYLTLGLSVNKSREEQENGDLEETWPKSKNNSVGLPLSAKKEN